MENNFKPLVLAFLQALPENPTEQYNEAFQLYKKAPNKNRHTEIGYNRKGYSPQNLKNLLYDLQKVAGITDLEVHDKSILAPAKETEPSGIIVTFRALGDDVQKAIFELGKANSICGDIFETVVTGGNKVLEEYFKPAFVWMGSFIDTNLDILRKENILTAEELFSMFTSEIASTELPEAILAEIKGILASVESKKTDDFIKELVVKGVITDVETDNEDAVALRQEFPFLNDADCPDVIYVLVGRRIAANTLYKNLYYTLQEINEGKKEATAEEKEQITIDCEAAFSENRKLWDELNYYGEHKEFLGKHPLFRESYIKKEVEIMTTEEMFKFKKNSDKYFFDQKAALLKHKANPKKIEEINAKIADRKYKLLLIDSRIGAGEKK